MAEIPATHVISLSGEEVIPSPQILLRRSKRYRASDAQKFTRVLEEAAAAALPLLKPAAVWALKPFDPDDPSSPPHLPEGLSRRLTLHFGVVCTIGGQLEACSHEAFQRGDYALGYFIDQIGTFAVARVAQVSASRLCEQYGAIRWAPGDHAKQRFTQAQEDLFSWVPAEQIGVRLNAQRVMAPAKSLSYNLFAGPDLRGVKCTIPCGQCVWDGACDPQRQPA